MATLKKHRILILGVSGFLGTAIYKELCSYYSTFGTYRTPLSAFENNKQFYHYDFEEDDIFKILTAVKPTLIISALRGDFAAQLTAHKHLYEYISSQKNCKMIFLSSANVFDAYSKFPSYENDTTLSNSIYGHFKIRPANASPNAPIVGFKSSIAIKMTLGFFSSLIPCAGRFKATKKISTLKIRCFINL